jgi:hypothetical protein
MALDAEDVRRFGEAVDRVNQLQERLGMSPVNGMNSSVITVNAGGVGIWIASTACLVMLGMMLVGGLWISRELTRSDTRAAEQEVKIDRANTFLAAIWANAPELEMKVKSEQEKESAE